VIAPDTEHDSLEPASSAPGQQEAGSTRSASTRIGDIVRAAVVALFVAASIGSPQAALLLVPIVPAIVALRIVRGGAHRSFLPLMGACVVVVALAAPDRPDWFPSHTALFVALGITVLLGAVHAQAVRPDPVSADTADMAATTGSAPPEPRLGSGFNLALLGWVAVAAVALLMSGLDVAGLRAGVTDAVDVTFRTQVDGCADGGLLASNEALCAGLLEQYERVREFTRSHVPEVVAVVLALFLLASAATAYLVVLARARRIAVPSRPAWRLRDFEAHWGAAYACAVGIGLVALAGTFDGAIEPALRGVGVFVTALGALLLLLQGFGLVAWWVVRSRLRTWQRVVLVLGAYLTARYSLPIVLGLGMVDMALRPRRRSSVTLTGRGSGS
jgi:hypothetical protein